MKPFDVSTVPLSGTKLIEASAGTGKTYAIASLYVRLLVEEDLLPERILVVTFTEAATKELRGRIRNRIREALAYLQGGTTEDPFLLGLAANAGGRMPDAAVAIDRLSRALVSFDLASIYTIHGFCYRALLDHAFESGSLFDTELSTDQLSLLEETVDDFWRSRFFSGKAELLPLVLQKGWSAAELTRLLKGRVTNPHLTFVPHFTAEEISLLDREIVDTFATLRNVWSERGDEVSEVLRTNPGLSRSKDNYRDDVLDELLCCAGGYFSQENPFAVFAGFEKLTAPGIATRMLRKNLPPQDAFFDLCDLLHGALERRTAAFLCEAVDYVRARLPERKQAANVRCFDDLLNDLHEALQGASGPALADHLRTKYPAALIDEFQDTDPVQYRIFRTMYPGDANPLFLIGDPKQAIYSFRGADIFAYLEAKKDVAADSAYTMDRNWRSTPEMLAAFNALFAQVPAPFVYEMIGYQPVTAGKSGMCLDLPDGTAGSPLQVWFFPRGEKEKVISLGKARDEIARLVAAEVSRLLNDGRAGTATIEGRGILPEDIAVLVRSHHEGRLMQEALCALRIPSVVQATGSVFATREARELLTLMAALADPADEGRVRAALVTSILGRNGDDLATILDSSTAWETWLETFRGYHDMWREDGFLVAARALIDAEDTRRRLLSLPEGERRLTNLLHLFELVHAATVAGGLGMEGALAWLSERVAEPPEDEEYQIRLESDEKAVRIVTIHVSKGLEYAVVFCPFCFAGVRDDEFAGYHDESFRQCLDIGSPDLSRNQTLSRTEQLAENLRLLYVALTRARYRCYLVWGRFRSSESSAPAYLLHYPKDGGGEILDTLKKAVEPLSDEDILLSLKGLQEKCPQVGVEVVPDKGSVPYVPSVEAGEELNPRVFSGTIDRSWRIASFTSFARNSSHETVADRDMVVSLDDAAKPVFPSGTDIFSFPRGAKAGIVLHEIFEKLDFSGPAESAGGIVETVLGKHGFDPKWQAPVAGMVEQVRQVRLAGAEGEFSLSSLARGDWRCELDFFFPLGFLTSERLRALLVEQGEDHFAGVASRLGFTPARGMVRGFIDMVFRHEGRYYIVDWKSNHLGNTSADYAPERLMQEMERNLYQLQYLLYATALSRYLARRVPGYSYETHFGGVLYVFLRGVDASAGEACGIYRDRPSAALVESLTATLVGNGG